MFDPSTDGGAPLAPVIRDAKGNLYGTTSNWGPSSATNMAAALYSNDTMMANIGDASAVGITYMLLSAADERPTPSLLYGRLSGLEYRLKANRPTNSEIARAA